MLVQNLICAGITLVLGYIILLLLNLYGRIELNAESLLFVPTAVAMIYGVDFIVTPLTVKLKNAQKAGLFLGLGVGVMVGIFALHCRITETEVTAYIQLDVTTELIAAAVFIVLYLPVYLILTKMMKRGDVC